MITSAAFRSFLNFLLREDEELEREEYEEWLPQEEPPPLLSLLLPPPRRHRLSSGLDVTFSGAV